MKAKVFKSKSISIQRGDKMIIDTKGRKSHEIIVDDRTFLKATQYEWRCKRRKDKYFFIRCLMAKNPV